MTAAAAVIRCRVTEIEQLPIPFRRALLELAAGGPSVAERSERDCRRLTAQESAVAKLVGAGLDDRHVARELFIGIPTVKCHLTHIYTKLGISSRPELGALIEHAPRATANLPIG
jgi:DNA-binding NarL/FixJ family response regulator